jgi:hypothetical protein
MLSATNYFKNSLLTTLTVLLTCFTISLTGQNKDSEPRIKVTQTGNTYEIIGWETNVVYNPHTFTWFSWEEPVLQKSKAKLTKMVPVSEFDRPPVFDGYCLTQEDKLACSNEKLRAYVSNHFTEYPDAAREMGQEGLEYVTFTIDKNGDFEGNLKVISRDKPCKGCADMAVDIVASMEDKWFPAIKDGKTVGTQLTIPVRFNLVTK